MADPLSRPLKWSKNFQVYVEKHNLYDVFQELLKEMIISKPPDPLVFIRDQISRVAKGIYNPRAFIVGPEIAKVVGQRLAMSIGAKFLIVDDIVKDTRPSVQAQLRAFIAGFDKGDDKARKSLVSAIQQRLAEEDCEEKGYILYGFPQNKSQAVCAQQMGLLPRQVFIFFPDNRLHPEGEETEEVLGSKQEEEVQGESEPGEMELKMALSKSSIRDLDPEMHTTLLKNISNAYHFDIRKVITFEKLMRTPSAELDAELMGLLMTWKPCGGPFIPRVVIMGPPGSGKSSIADFLCKKFSLVNVDWIELIRGAERWDQESEIVQEAKAYLADLVPMTDDSVKTIISRRLQKDDCEKKGWVLHGFPENIKHCKILESLYLEPNRVFMLSCSQELSAARMAKKKKSVLKRQLDENVASGEIDETKNFLVFPFGEIAVTKRYENFAKSLDRIIPYFGSRIIYVDAEMKPTDVKNFVESSILRPPIPRKN